MRRRTGNAGGQGVSPGAVRPTVRLFVAVEVDPDRAGRPGLAAPQHLTLRFLGEVPEAKLSRVEELLRPVGRELAPFEMALEGVGAFPAAERPRVVWQAVTVGREEVGRLARKVREALAADFGLEPGPFVAHLTLFRVRSVDDRRAARDLLTGARPPPPARRCTVREFVLKQSVLGAHGAVHRTVATFPLEGPAGPPP